MSRFPRTIVSIFVLIFFLSFSSVSLANLDNKRDEPKTDPNLNSIDRINSRGDFSFGTSDWERQASAGFLGTGGDDDSFEEKVEGEREGIDKVHKEHDDAVDAREQQELKDWDKAQEQKYKEEAERKARLEKLDQEKLERDRADSQREIDRFNQNHGPSSGWTTEEHEKYDKLVEKNNVLNEPTQAEREQIDKQQNARDQVHNDIKKGAQQMGMMDDQSRLERENAHRMSNAATKGWRNWTFTGQMVNHVEQDIFNQREKGIVAKSMIISAEVYLKNPNLTPEQKKAAEQILAQNKFAMGAAADAISKDIAVILCGTTADVGMLGAGKAVTKVVGGLKTLIFGEAAASGTTAGATAGTTGATAAGTEAGTTAGAKVAGTEAGAQAGAKAAGQDMAQVQAAHDAKAAQEAGKAWRSGQNVNPGDSVVMPVEAAAAQAEMNAIKASASKLSQSEVDKLFQPGANLTPTQIIQKAEILAQREASAAATGAAPGTAANPLSGASGGWSEGATVIGGKAATPATGQAAAGGTQAFNGALTLPHPPPAGAVSGGTTQAFGGVMPIPGGAGTATAASEAATVSGNLTGNAAGGTTQAFKPVLPLPGGATTAATEAPTVVGNLTGQTQAFNKVLPVPQSGSVPPGVNPGGLSSEAGTVRVQGGGASPAPNARR